MSIWFREPPASEPRRAAAARRADFETASGEQLGGRHRRRDASPRARAPGCVPLGRDARRQRRGGVRRAHDRRRDRRRTVVNAHSRLIRVTPGISGGHESPAGSAASSSVDAPGDRPRAVGGVGDDGVGVAADRFVAERNETPASLPSSMHRVAGLVEPEPEAVAHRLPGTSLADAPSRHDLRRHDPPGEQRGPERVDVGHGRVDATVAAADDRQVEDVGPRPVGRQVRRRAARPGSSSDRRRRCRPCRPVATRARSTRSANAPSRWPARRAGRARRNRRCSSRTARRAGTSPDAHRARGGTARSSPARGPGPAARSPVTSIPASSSSSRRCPTGGRACSTVDRVDDQRQVAGEQRPRRGELAVPARWLRRCERGETLRALARPNWVSTVLSCRDPTGRARTPGERDGVAESTRIDAREVGLGAIAHRTRSSTAGTWPVTRAQSVSSPASSSISRPSCQLPSADRSYWRITPTGRKPTLL